MVAPAAEMIVPGSLQTFKSRGVPQKSILLVRPRDLFYDCEAS